MMTRSDILEVLDDPERCAEDLFAEARKVRRDVFDGRVFLYGFLYVSSFCRNNCSFCLSRRDNTSAARYRKAASDAAAYAGMLAESGVHLVDVTSGEDQAIAAADIKDLFVSIRKQTGLPLMASVGVIDEERTELLGHADWYACYQETHNRELFSRLRIDQDYDRRYNSKVMARRKGVFVEEGIMTGVGESSRDIADSMAVMRSLGAEQVRVMSFVPQKGTPMQDVPPPPSIRELVTIALLRISFPDRLIPASLDVAGLAGLSKRLDAGANVVTSIVPPGTGLAGVANAWLDIENGCRTVEAVRPILAACNLRAAGADDYLSWIGSRKGCA